MLVLDLYPLQSTTSSSPSPFRRPYYVYNPPPPALGDTHPASGGPARTGGAVTPPGTQPPPTNTAKGCSIILFSKSGTQRHPATNFGVLEIRGELDGRKTTDRELLMVCREIFFRNLRPPPQRLLSFRGLKHIVFVEFTNEEQPVSLVMNAKLRRDLIHVFNKPNLISTDDWWVNLFCGLGEDPHHDYGLLFVDDWDRQKIAVLVGVPWAVSVATAVIWIASTGDIGNAMAVSSYIMSATGVVVGLLAVLSAIEA